MEIERKFLLNQIPDNFTYLNVKRIEQGYLSFNPEVRIRRLDNQYYLTVKCAGDIAREEFEIEISENTYYDLKNNVVGTLLIKDRYYVEIEDLIAEVDIYKNFEDLKMVEVEFSDEVQAIQFCVPDWFGREVTYDKGFKNKNLFKILNGKEWV